MPLASHCSGLKSPIPKSFARNLIIKRGQFPPLLTASAQIVVMRKIVTITYSLYKTGTIYDETRYEKWNNVKSAS